MGQVLHGCAHRTEAVRRAIQERESAGETLQRQHVDGAEVEEASLGRRYADGAEDASIDRAEQ